MLLKMSFFVYLKFFIKEIYICLYFLVQIQLNELSQSNGRLHLKCFSLPHIV